jgi:hypothetical protein
MAPKNAEPKGPVGHSRTLTAEGRRRRARLSSNSRHRPDQPELLDEDRRWLKAAAAERYVRELVDGLPALTAEQRARLAAILNGADDAGPT